MDSDYGLTTFIDILGLSETKMLLRPSLNTSTGNSSLSSGVGRIKVGLKSYFSDLAMVPVCLSTGKTSEQIYGNVSYPDILNVTFCTQVGFQEKKTYSKKCVNFGKIEITIECEGNYILYVNLQRSRS